MPFGFKSVINGSVADLDTLLVQKTVANNVLGGETITWGYNFDAQIGDNTTIHRSSPVMIGPGNDQRWFTQISSSYHRGGIKNDGSLWMWGNNIQGTLGLNDRVHRSSPIQVGASSWTTVNVGGESSFAIRSDGTLWAWGYNDAGQLGLGDTISRSSPIQIGTSSWINVSASSSSAAAIRSDGALFVWGWNPFGNLGLNDLISRSSPVQIGASSWVNVYAHLGKTYAIRSDGALFTWGYNSNGDLGLNDVIHRSSPVQVGTSSWVIVSGGAAIRADGALFVWGINTNGRLGFNSSELDLRSSPTQVGTGTNWVDVYSDTFRNTHAIKADGSLWTWGYNSSGDLGDNTTIHRSSPIQISTYKYWRRLGGAGAALS